jgi:hypothetical protein
MIRKIAAPLLLACVVLITGCATVIPPAAPELDQAAKTFTAPAEKAGLYIYRNELLGSAIKFEVALDGKRLGELPSKNYFYVEVPPGKHTVTGKAENESSVEFEALPGRLYYVWQEAKMGVFIARNLVQLVDEKVGRAAVMECRRIDLN